MKISEERLKKICSEKNITISELLAKSGVSRNAYYTLARKKNILPNSITALSDTLNISAIDILDIEPSPIAKAEKLYSDIERITSKHKDIDRDNVKHTLQLLDEKPIDRLRRALTRAQRFNFQ